MIWCKTYKKKIPFYESKFVLFSNKGLKKKNNEPCSATLPCNNVVGLTCQAGICKCASNMTFDGSKCGTYLTLL